MTKRKPPDPKLVERVARALARELVTGPWRNLSEEVREDYRALARAAIKAMGR